MTPAQAGEYDRCLGVLLQCHALNGTDFAILNRMFWGLRSRGSDLCQATLDLIKRKTGASLAKIVETVRKAVELGIMLKLKGDPVWRVIKGIGRWVNGANTYVFRMPEEMPEPEVVLAVFDARKIVPESPDRVDSLESKRRVLLLSSLGVCCRARSRKMLNKGSLYPPTAHWQELTPTDLAIRLETADDLLNVMQWNWGDPRLTPWRRTSSPGWCGCSRNTAGRSRRRRSSGTRSG